ncbi:hypothetical protein EDB86DRAFT_3092795 [Lactarius hatsudake]|nr:hypothetical protein EDB86DRAFT_3092795 [Lactarius hatsudake]
MAYHLSHVSHFISATLTTFLSMSSDPIPISTHENVCWSCLLINSIPTRTSLTHGPFTSDELHHVLTTDNPVYHSLEFMQAPSWVRHPDSYQPGSTSLIVFAFEDPDGTMALGLLANWCLYAFGCAGSLKHWKAKPCASPPTS